MVTNDQFFQSFPEGVVPSKVWSQLIKFSGNTVLHQHVLHEVLFPVWKNTTFRGTYQRTFCSTLEDA